METVIAVILGIVEGLTEFLPVSSTGHLIITGNILSFNNPEFENMFNVVIQFGAISAVIFYFWKRIFPFGKPEEERKRTFRLWFRIAAGFIPAAVLGVLLDDLIDTYLFNPVTVAAALIVGAVLIFIAEGRSRKKIQTEQLEDISYRHAFIVGFFQCLAMWPGMSRSASTIIGGIFCGFSRAAAAEFSFLLGIPTIMGASLFKLMKGGLSFTSSEWGLIGIGTVVSFLTALLVIHFFMGYLRKYSLKPFAIYRIVLGAAVLIFCL